MGASGWVGIDCACGVCNKWVDVALEVFGKEPSRWSYIDHLLDLENLNSSLLVPHSF